AAVTAAVETVAHRHRVADPRLAGSHPHHPGPPGIHRDRPDRRAVLVEDRLEAGAAVARLPDPAAGRADVEREPFPRHTGDRGDAARGDPRADRSWRETREGLGA